MAYSIFNNDGTILARIADSTIDNSSTSLTFVGKDYNNLQYIAQNFVTLLSNTASSSQPRSPIKGQLWYDTSANKLKVFDTAFTSISAVYSSEVAPIETSSIGEFWFNPRNNSLNFNTPTKFGWETVSTYPMDQTTGWVVPQVAIVDNFLPRGISQPQTTLLYNQDPSSAVGVLSQQTFIASTNSTAKYFSLSGQTNYSVVKGLNIIGSIAATETLVSNGLTVSTSFTPTSANSPGTKGQIAWDVDYVYVCIADGVWRRAALTSW